jgi:hypothetical protein
MTLAQQTGIGRRFPVVVIGWVKGNNIRRKSEISALS